MFQRICHTNDLRRSAIVETARAAAFSGVRFPGLLLPGSQEILKIWRIDNEKIIFA